MKLKINKACDLSSISVLPPQSRRSNAIGSGTETSVFGKSQASQLRSQQSQQSFSQGMSSQLSQNSLDEILTNEQKFCSQGENSARRTSCLAPVVYNREENQMPLSRSSNNQLRRWGSVPVQDQRCQVSDELEHRIGQIETSINRFGILLDSVQGDVMQVNKAIKEVLLETEGIRKKLTAHDSSLQLMIKGEEDIKSSLDESLKCIPDQVRKDLHQCRLQETVSILLSLPRQIEAQFLKIQSQISDNISKELEVVKCCILNTLSWTSIPNFLFLYCGSLSDAILSNNTHPPDHKITRSSHMQSQKEQIPATRKPVILSNARRQSTPVPKIKAENHDFIKPKQTYFRKRQYNVNQKQEEISIIEQDRKWRVIIESDEEIDEGFSCLLEEKKAGVKEDLFDDVKGEAERILRKARRKRKHCNPIIVL